MEKIRIKPLEAFKNIIIALLTVSMLVLAGIYIGGSQFSANNAAINAQNMPQGAVAVGNDAPESEEMHEKGLLAISFAAIRHMGGGGTYGNEQAAADLFDFAKESIHTLLSSNAMIVEIDGASFRSAVSGRSYVYFSFANALPYQAVYALTGEYVAAAGCASAINVESVLLDFDAGGKTSLYMKDGEKYYLATADCFINLASLAAMSSDTRLADFTLTENAVAISDASPHTQTLALGAGKMPSGKAYVDMLTLLGYDADDIAPMSMDISIVAPHGTLTMSDEVLSYTASNDGGIQISDFLANRKNTLDIDMYDILSASVTLIEQLRSAYPEMTGKAFSLCLDGFYNNEDTFTVVFGLCDSSIPISGTAFPYLARFSVSGGRFKSIELRFINAERIGKTVSPSPSKWEYSYASRTREINSFLLRYKADTLPEAELDARWYFSEVEK